MREQFAFRSDYLNGIARVRWESFKGRVLFHTKYSDYFEQNLSTFDEFGLLAELIVAANVLASLSNFLTYVFFQSHKPLRYSRRCTPSGSV